MCHSLRADEIHKFGSDEKELLRWARRMSMAPLGAPIGSWGEGFNDGMAFCAILHQTDPKLLDLEAARKMEPRGRLELAFYVAES